MSQSTEMDGKGKGLSQKAELCVVSQMCVERHIPLTQSISMTL